MATYIFAIGGSGARVLRSLTMLLASGCHNTSINNEIVANVIDYDTDNGDSLRTQELLELYHDIHIKAYQNGDTVDGQPVGEHFFCTPLRMLREKCDPNVVGQLDPNAKFNLYLAQTITNTTFADYIGYGNLGVGTNNLETMQLLDSLYATDPERLAGTNDDNPKAELKMNLHKGFRGCPNLGCIVTKQLETSPELNLAVKTLIQPTDKVVIIGSVFGGTGASGIPMLLDMLNGNPNTQPARKAVIGVMPYFNVVQNNNSSIDSNTFVAKAKAAIGAYEGTINNQTDCFYYIGDNPQNAYANNDGERKQINDAHYVELVSAMCVMDFLTQLGNQGFECFLQNWMDQVLKIDAFYKNEMQTPYIHPLARFKLFSTFCKNYLFAGKNNTHDIWLNGTGANGCKAIGDANCRQYRDNIHKFINEFDKWIKELSNAQTHRPLILFNNTNDYKDVWENQRIEVKSSISPRHPRMGWELHDSDFCRLMTDSFNALNPQLGQGITNRPEYLFWRGAKYTMDHIDNILRNKNLLN